MKKGNLGFTLIELLVTISIIAILTALLTANFIGARQRARDGQRKSNLYQIQAALELYRSDNGIYPFPTMAPSPGCSTTNSSPVSLSGGTAPNTVTYMQSIPCDPSTNTAYKYTSTDGTSYTLFACLENAQDQDIDTNPSDTNAVTGCTATTYPFKLTNP